MVKSKTARAVDEVQAIVASYLKTLKFRKSGRTFNRCGEDGVVHVINFQMGSYPIGKYVVPGLRENLYGKFTVNLGIRLPCISAADGRKDKNTYQEYDCHIRSRLSRDADGGRGTWWTIEGDYARVACEIAVLLEKGGIPFLDQFSSYRDVLAYYDRCRVFPFRTDARSALDAALVSRQCGYLPRYKELIQEAKKLAQNHGGFRDYVGLIEKQFDSGK